VSDVGGEPSRPGRIAWLDMARGLGIIAVFYGHVVEPFFRGSTEPSVHHLALLQWKLIYAFHIPLFFFLAGCTSRTPSGSFRDFFAMRVRSRLFPVLLFGLLALPFELLRVAFSDDPMGSLIHLAGSTAKDIVLGHDLFITVTWFLVALFVVEVAHFLLYERVRAHPLLVALSLYLLAGTLQAVTTANPWEIRSALHGYAFFLLGRWWFGKEDSRATSTRARPSGPLLFLLFSLATVATFDLNDGRLLAFSSWLGSANDFGVLLFTGSTGNLVLFPFTAICGIAAVILFARLLPPCRAVLYVGRHSLLFFCLDGFFLAYVNGWLASAWVACFSTRGWSPALTIVFSVVACAVQVLLCVPLVDLIEKHWPTLAGRRSHRTSVIPRWRSP
jgi:acyltransferase